MINEIGSILKDYLEAVPFKDKLAGVVRVITKTDQGTSGLPIRKSFPVDCNVDHDDCVKGRYVDLIPNSKYKSIIYFEDQGIRPVVDNVRDFNFEASLKLVCWLNLKKLGKTACNNSGVAIATILNAIPTSYFNNGVYTRILVQFAGIDVKSPQIFSKYTYDEEKTQFLMYPYDYFSMSFTVRFTISKSCIPTYVVDPEIICNS